MSSGKGRAGAEAALTEGPPFPLDLGGCCSDLRTPLSCVLVVLLSVLPALRAQQPETHHPAPADARALLRQADEALNRRDFAAAVKSLKPAVEIEPRLTEAWFDLAYAYSALNEKGQAIQAYRRALELQPELFEARLNLGILLIETQQAQASVEHLEKAVALKPGNPKAHLYYGRALGLVKRPADAGKQFQEALRLDPGLAIAHFDLGELFLAQKRYEEARLAFEKAAGLDLKLAQAQLGIALALEGLNRQAEAALHFEQYLARKPDDLETRFHLARVYLYLEKNEQALENLQAVYRANPSLAGLAAALGDVNALLKRFSDSEKFYRQALVVTPLEPDLHRALGQTLLDEEKFAEAEGEFRTALKLDSRNREAAKGLATSLYLQKRYAEAIPLFEALIRTPDPTAGFFFVLGSCYDHLHDRPNALKAYEHFLELSHGESPDHEWQARQRVKLLRRELAK